MEQVAISALQADIVHLALAAVGVMAVVIALLVFFGSRAISNILTSFANTIKANSQLTDAMVLQGNQLSSMVRTLERGQDIQKDQTSAMLVIRDTLTHHEGHSEERSQAMLEKIEAVTDLIGTKVSESAAMVMGSMQPLMDTLREIKTGLENARSQAKMQQDKQAEILNAIETKVEMVSEQIIGVVQSIEEIDREDKQQVGSVGDHGAVGGDVSGVSGGSTGDNGTGGNDGGSGTTGGTIA